MVCMIFKVSNLTYRELVVVGRLRSLLQRVDDKTERWSLTSWCEYACFSSCKTHFFWLRQLRLVRRSLDIESQHVWSQDLEIWAWSVSADARWSSLAGYSSASAVQACCDIHHCLRHRAPRYLADSCVPVSEVTGRQHLWSARCHQLSVPIVRHSTFGTTLDFLSPMPDHLRHPAVDSEQLRWDLKMYLFTGHWSVSTLEVFT